MTISQFIRANLIKPADAIIMTKKFFGMLDHYVIYMGCRNNNHQFVANYTDGIKIIPNSELVQFLQVLKPTSIDRFPGNEIERYIAVARAKSRIGEKAYGLINNNCEHFKNWVHFGKEKSSQVETFGGSLAVVGISVAAYGVNTKNDTTTAIGVITAILGGMAWLSEREKNAQI